MSNLYIHRSVGSECHVTSVQSTKLVGPLYTFVLPVCPVDEVLEYRHGEYMRQVLPYHVLNILTIQVCECDVIQSGIGPEDFLSVIIDGERVWPAEVLCDEAAVDMETE